MEYAELMVRAFPELKAVFGSYVPNGTPFQHSWCVDPEGNVRDVGSTTRRRRHVAEFDHRLDPEFVDVPVELGERHPCRVRVPLSRSLNDWVDWDIAMFEVGRLLGIFDPDSTWEAFRTSVKGIIWSDSLMNRHLKAILSHLVEIGYLEYDDEEQKFRHNQSFKWGDCQ